MTEALPQALDAERFVLGSMLVEPDLMPELRDALTADDWTIEAHRRVWAQSCDLFDSGIQVDRITLAEKLRDSGKLESVGGLAFLVDLSAGLPRLPNVSSYVRLVKDKAFLRRAMLAAHELGKRCALGMDTPDEIAQFAHGLLTTLTVPDGRDEFQTPAEIVDSIGFDALMRPRRRAGAVTLPWGWLDRNLGGLAPEQLVIIGGRTSQGKTSAALQIAVSAAGAGLRVPIFSLEMSSESLVQRMAIQRSGLDAERIRDGSLGFGEREHLSEAIGWVHDLPLHILGTAARNVIQISGALRRFITRFGSPGLVVVDHLHALASSDRSENRTQQVSADARALKLLAKECRCPLVVPAQLNTSTSRDNEVPTLADLRSSGEIAECADVVLFVWLDLKDENPIQRGRFVVAKQREGRRDISRAMLFERSSQVWRECDGSYD
jgi:replicative DNA helicase